MQLGWGGVKPIQSHRWVGFGVKMLGMQVLDVLPSLLQAFGHRLGQRCIAAIGTHPKVEPHMPRRMGVHVMCSNGLCGRKLLALLLQTLR